MPETEELLEVEMEYGFLNTNTRQMDLRLPFTHVLYSNQKSYNAIDKDFERKNKEGKNNVQNAADKIQKLIHCKVLFQVGLH